MILIIANELDAHADAVVLDLKSYGFNDIARIDLEHAHDDLSFEVRPTELELTTIKSRAGTFSFQLRDVKTLWWRRDSSQDSTLHCGIADRQDINAAESYWTLRWLLEALPDDYFPFGHPKRHRAASNKIAQLKVATEIGFRTPATVLTNEKKTSAAFALEHTNVVIKPLKISFAKDAGVGFTILAKSLSSSEFFDRISGAEKFHIFAQGRIHKRADVRLNIWPGLISACAIDNSHLGDNEVDWRPTTLEHDHKIIDVPPIILEQCQKYLKRMQLTSGMFDFGLDEREQWTFFECNPNAQWLWIQLKTSANLSNAVAKALLDHCSRSKP